MYNGLHVTCPLFLCDFNETWNFSTDFRKNTQIPNFMNIRKVGAELFYADGWKDGQADMTKLLLALRKFANEPKMARYNATIVRTLSIS